MKILILLAMLAQVTACAAQTQAEAPTPSPTSAARFVSADAPQAAREDFESSADICEMRETRTPQGLRLEAVALSDRTVDGSYELVISARNPGGTSDVSQAGQMVLVAGQRASLGITELPPGPYRATLILRDADGEICRLERRS